MSATKVYLKEVSEQYTRTKKALEAWNQSDGPNVHYEGHLTKGLSSSLRMEFERLIDATADEGREVEEKARPVVMALDDFALQYARWLRQAAVDAESPRGSSAMWRAWDHVEQAFQPITQNKPHTVKYLIDVLEAPREQIARIYGWVDAHGNADTVKVQEEYETPGTHFNPDEWVSPAYRGRMAQVANQWGERIASRKPLFRVVDETEGEAAPPTPVPVASIEELLEVGAPPEQIARLHDIEVEDARTLIKEHMEAKAIEEVETSKARAKAGGRGK